MIRFPAYTKGIDDANVPAFHYTMSSAYGTERNGSSVGRQKVKSDRGYNPGLSQYMQGDIPLSYLAALLEESQLQQPQVVHPNLPHPLTQSLLDFDLSLFSNFVESHVEPGP